MQRRLESQATPRLAYLLWKSSAALLSQGEPTMALPLIEEAMAIGERLLVSSHPHLAEYRRIREECRKAIER